MDNIKTINFENVSILDRKTFYVRNSVRAVIFDDENNIGLMKVKGGSFYKLPGGGIEKGENKESALKRECMEEAGINIEIIAKLGKVIEIKKIHKMIQNSYCYLAKVVGKKGVQNLTENEIKDEYEVEWIKLKDAVLKVKKSGYNFPHGKYVFDRENIILQWASER